MTQFRAFAGSVRRAGVRGKVGLLLIVLGAAVLAGPAPEKQPPAAPAPDTLFDGNWSATGTRQVLAMGPDRQAVVIHLSGSLVLKNTGGLNRGFRSEMVGYDDGRKLAIGSCVWTDDQGDQVFSDIQGGSVQAGRRFTGIITGGTGRYAGLTGEYEFAWGYVLHAPDGTVQGRVVGLKGRVRRGAAPPAQAPAGQVPK